MDKRDGEIFLATCKFFIFFAILSAVIMVPVSEVMWLGNLITDKSFTESLQLLFLFVIGSLFFRLAFLFPERRAGNILMACFFFTLMIRELDYFLDYVYHGFWLVPALLVTAIGVSWALFHINQTREGLCVFLRTRYFDIMCIGLVLLLSYSRIIGMGKLWQHVMGENYERVIKIFAEECTELMSYAVCLIAAIGYYLSQIKEKKRPLE